MTEFKEGDLVYVLSNSKVGVVAEVLDNKKIIVALDKIELCVHCKHIQLIECEKQRKSTYFKFKSSVVNIQIPKIENFLTLQTEVDFHGYLVHEALEYLDIWIDKAIFAGQKSLKIIHGKGTGALRTAIRQYLKTHKHVKITKAPTNSFEDGITYINLC
jgi:DNA mismatch repair protein MutS2